MIRVDEPRWLDVEATGDAPWCSRIQVQHIISVSLVPFVQPDDKGQPAIVEGVYVVRINASGDRHEFNYNDLIEAQDEYARIMRALDGDELEVH